jgi:hypothetical protein
MKDAEKMAKAGDKKPRSERRRAGKIVQKRVTEAQHVAFARRAAAAGYETPKDYLEAFVLGNVAIKRRERRDQLKLFAELSKQGSNLNQIACAINPGRVTQLSQSDKEVIEAIQALHGTLIKRLGKALS